ncbi:MAG: nickel-responsive transcriptional regulator NikR [Polyangiaceae bacterium]
MSDLVRFGVAMERELLQEFDRRIAAKGYENRSEALRDLVRADLVRAAWDGGAQVTATLTVVLSRDARDATLRLAEIEADPARGVLSSMRVPLDGGRALAVLALRGRAGDLTALAGQLAGSKGVQVCELSPATVAGEDRARTAGGTP